MMRWIVDGASVYISVDDLIRGLLEKRQPVSNHPSAPHPFDAVIEALKTVERKALE